MARYDLGLPEDDIGTLTLREFDALLQRARARDNRERLNAGIVAACVLNSAMGDPNRKPAHPLDWVPDWKPKTPDLTQMSPEEQKWYLMNMFTKRTMRS